MPTCLVDLHVYIGKIFFRYCENFVVVLLSPLIALVRLPRVYPSYVGLLTMIFLLFTSIQHRGIFAFIYWLSFVIAWTLFPFCALGWCSTINKWAKHIRTYGLPGWRLCRAISRLSSIVGDWGGGWLLGKRSVINKPGRKKEVIGSVFYDVWEFASYALIMFIIIDSYMFLAYGIYGPLTICLCTVADTVLPPALLFLATSGRESFDLLLDISQAISPLKVATLLDRDTALTTDSGDLNESRLGTDFRALDGSVWRDSVNRLIDLVPIVVLDARRQSAFLIEEASWLLKAPYIRKTIFVTKTTCDWPCLMADQNVKQALKCVNAHNVTRCTQGKTP